MPSPRALADALAVIADPAAARTRPTLFRLATLILMSAHGLTIPQRRIGARTGA